MKLFNFTSKKDKEISNLRKELREERKARIQERKRHKELCEEKDSFYKAAISDGLRHKSSWAAKQMNDRKKYLNER